MSEEKASQTEREFLHDISNQLVIAQGMGSFVNGKIGTVEGADEKLVKRMEKCVKSVERMIEMVKSRRDFIKSQENNS